VRLLSGRRFDDDIREPPEASGEREAVGRGPRLHQDRQRFGKASVGFSRGNAKSFELRVAVAFADPEMEPPAREHIEGRRLFGQQHRVVPRQDQHSCAHPQTRRPRRDPIQEVQGRRHLRPAGEVVLYEKAAVVAESLRLDIVLDVIIKPGSACGFSAAEQSKNHQLLLWAGRSIPGHRCLLAGSPNCEKDSFEILPARRSMLPKSRAAGARPMDRTDSLALFVKAVEAGSLSGAARESGLSLPSVSRHITALEERIGTRLVVRTTRCLALTEAGRAYYEHAKQPLADLAEVEAGLLADAAVPAGKVNLWAPTLFGRVFIVPLLARFLADNRRVSLDVTLLDRDFNPVEEGVDLAIRIGPLKDSSLIARRLGSLLWVVSGAPEDLDRRGEPAAPEDLKEHDCLVFTQPGYEWRFRKNGRDVSMRGPARMSANALAAAVAGAGLVYAPAWQVRDHVAAGRLKVVLRAYEVPALPVNALLSHTRLLSNKVRSLLEYLARELGSCDFSSLTDPDISRVRTGQRQTGKDAR
jgi:DNA-binding transcriptional LysR family regulator